jgi:protein required for attachment to host cells
VPLHVQNFTGAGFVETRVIVADNRRARIFSSHTVLKHLQEQEGFVHDKARLSNRELVGDAAGKSVDHHGSLEPATSPRDHETQVFAKALSKHLKELHNARHFDQLILVAPPKFLGLLLKELPGPLDQLVSRKIDKDLTLASVEDIIDYIIS